MKRLALLLPVLFVLFVSCSRSPAPTPKPPAPPYDAAMRDGSTIFWQGGLLVKPILKHTNSNITHAAIVLYEGRKPFVYEAVPPVVHKVPLAEYQQHMEEKVHESRRSMTWFVMQPGFVYTAHELAAMKAHAESQLGRKYVLRGWWQDRETAGIFCSWYVADVLEKSGKITSSHWHESPGSLHDKLLPLYEERTQ